MKYDYSILTDYFPESVIEEFYASAIDPRLCLLNAEFLNGDKAISELLGEIKIHNNNGTLKKGYRDTYASIVEHGGISYTGINIERDCIASCNSFKPLQPRLDKEGKPIKYEHPAKKPCKAFLPVIDWETWQAISVRVGVALPPDLVTRQWQLVDIGSDEWRDDCQRLSLAFLQWLRDDSTIPVTTTEGAKKALSGISTGEICISLTGVWNGCPELNKGEKDYTLINDLKLISTPNRRINIAFDKDSKPKTINMVRAATKRFAGLLIAADCQVYLADWSSDRGKGIDDLIFNCGIEAFHQVIDGAKQFETAAIDDEAYGSKKPLKSVAERLLEIGRTATYFQTPDRVAYADIAIAGNRHTYAVRSRAFRMWLSGEYFNVEGKGIGSQTMQDTLSTLEAIALYGQDSATREVHLRIAQERETIYLDLGTPDWKAIEIDPTGWPTIDDPPVRFWRPDSLRPLPYPVVGGNLAELRELLNVDGSAWTLIITFLLFCFCPNKTYPVLVLSAHRGSGKTVAAEMLKGLIDPGKAPLIKLQGDTHKLAVSASRRLLMVYDNVGHISADQSDDLCRIATGFGYSTRTLFSTDEETTFEFARPQIVTAIDSLVTRDDLADRVLMVQLGEISEQQRLPQAELNAKIEAARPRILGALLTALSQTFAALPDIEPDKLPRMADYALFAIASETALGLNKGEFMSVFNDSRELSRQVVIESSPVGEAIIRLMEHRKAWEPWQGTASELLNELEHHTDEATYRSRYFPKAANVLKRQLNRLAPDLKALGIDVREARIGKVGTRQIVLEKCVILSSVSSAECQHSEKTSQDNDCRADDISMADDKVDGKADDILTADDKADDKNEDIVSHRNTEQQRVSRLADDADDKNPPSTSSNRSLRFKIGDLVRYSGSSANLKRQYAGNLTIREFSKSGDSYTCLKPNGNLTSWIEFNDLEFVAV
ncbi:DUF3854 domain-containing protein [Chamaesiphon sp.]|uniref:DUF3854 domain-containing protein n=1 Tax=Chamaesiphon sp. TaxID=2814140 RepID=UPI003593EF6B